MNEAVAAKVPGSLSWMSQVLSGFDWYESVVDVKKGVQAARQLSSAPEFSSLDLLACL